MPPSMKPPVVYRKSKEKEGIVDYQNFADHIGMAERFKKTLCYGKLPKTDRPSLPMTELAVELFSKAVGRAEGLGQIDMHYAASVSRNACMSPYSMILAIAYIERLKRKSPDYLRQVSSSDLFLVSMMVASKFLYDEGEDEEVFNEEWAKSANMEAKEINFLERKFLAAIDWNVFLGTEGFLEILREMEFKIAKRKTKELGSCTYTDLTILLESLQLLKCWHLLMDSFVKVIAVSVVAYSTSILTILGAVIVGHQAHLQAAHIVERIRCPSSNLSECLSSPSSRRHTGLLLESEPGNDTTADVYLPCHLLSDLSRNDDCKDCRHQPHEISSSNNWNDRPSRCPHSARRSNLDRRSANGATSSEFASSPSLLDLSARLPPVVDHPDSSARCSCHRDCVADKGVERREYRRHECANNRDDSPPPIAANWSPPYHFLENVTSAVVARSSMRLARDWLYCGGSSTVCIGGSGPGFAAFR